MKKSLHVMTSAALVCFMFASVGWAAAETPSLAAKVRTSADFKDLATADAALKARIDALLAKGYIDGKGENFDLTGQMNRAEAAKLAAKVFQFKLDDKASSSFSDVDSADASIGWSIPFIEAAKAQGIIEGMAESTFAPREGVTLGQLAALLVRGLGKSSEVQSTEPWYNGYLAAAKANGVDLGTDGAKAASRADLVSGFYQVDQVIADAGKPAKVSVKEAKQTGVKKVIVTLDRDVDTTKVTIDLTKGAARIAASVKWSDDKRSAVLTLTDTNITEGDYTVTLGGLEASLIEKSITVFTGQSEKLVKLEFVNTGDTIAKAQKVKIEFKPANQFGETASFAAGRYTVHATTAETASLSKLNDGKLYVNLNTAGTGMISNLSQVTVQINDNDQHLSAVKTFTVGGEPYVAKVELGQVTYKNGKTALTNSGEKAVIPLIQYDQYGGLITKESTVLFKPQAYLSPNEQNIDLQFADDNNDGEDDVVVTTTAKIDQTAEYTLTVAEGASTATAKVNLKAGAVAKKVELVQPIDTWANGDNNKYIGIVAYDSEGSKLSTDDIVQNAKDGRFTITTSSNLYTGASTDIPAVMLDSKGQIVKEGPNKGKLYIRKLEGKGTARVFVGLFGIGVNSQAELTIPVVSTRYPAGFKVITDVAAKALDNATVGGKIQIVDQYGDKIGVLPTNSAGKVIDQVENGRSVTYDVYATVTPSVGYVGTYSGDLTLTPGSRNLTMAQISDKEFKMTPGGSTPGAALTVKFSIRKRDFTGGVVGEVLNDSFESVTKKFTVIDPTNVKLTYSLTGARDIYSTLDDSMSISTPAALSFSSVNKLAAELTLSAKDESAEEVKVPDTIITVTSNAYDVARGGVSLGKGYVLGNKAGKAKVTASYRNAKGETQIVSTTITVKSDPIIIKSIVSSAVKTFARSTVYNDDGVTVKTQGADGALTWMLMSDLTLKDQYAGEYKNANVDPFHNMVPVIYMVNDVSAGLTVTLTDSYDGVRSKVNVTFDPSVTKGSFTLTAVTANGIQTATRVIVNN
ncbi:S-layer homology domain-containing protein [Paenibacillus alba]|uniref:S-layer homology domain-containing protein n=1 Tax=Paenibacillus alba TaxID=1197127 RepID=A0ABU6GC52_9BACL|nr:S-layer homology domain-containing protein [Paenibacillus alba]MEC0231772.1 S-layer homology domain-containing protein [Paenibacillus alba]